MIKIKDKRKCCGCGACVQKCPQHCISITVDNEGFEYPEVDLSRCTDCGLCEKVCPLINCGEQRQPLGVYAVKNTNDEIRERSSSGGVFSLLAQQVLRDGGVVFGARFDDSWQVVIDYTEKEEELDKFRRSKYLQAQIGESYIQAQAFLKQGREVLYSGTPCQILGLKRFLRIDYPNLQTVDFVCHGVPSPKVWHLYKDYRLRNHYEHFQEQETLGTPSIADVNFRDKLDGTHWEDFHISLDFKSHREQIRESTFIYDDLYMRLFLSDVILRPSCYKCPVRQGKSNSIITIADYWSINDVLPKFNDHKGVSLLLVYNERIKEYLEKAENIEMISTAYEVATKYNGGFSLSVPVHPRRNFFFRNLDKDNFVDLAKVSLDYRPSFLRRMTGSLLNRLRSLLRLLYKKLCE